jgi:hypothetical protein
VAWRDKYSGTTPGLLAGADSRGGGAVRERVKGRGGGGAREAAEGKAQRGIEGASPNPSSECLEELVRGPSMLWSHAD